MPFATVDGIATYYAVEGTGPAVLLHHGLMGTSAAWRRDGYVDALKSSRTVITVDSRGHGQSDKPHDPAEYAPGKRSSDIIRVLDDLGIEKVDLIGYSMGGKIVYEICHFAPERVRSFVSGASSMQVPLGLYESLDSRFVLAWFDRQSSKMPPEEVDERRAELAANDFTALKASVHPDTRTHAEQYRESLRELDIPMLFFVGDADPFHDGVEELCVEMRNSSFVSIPGADHATAVKAALPQVVEFLNSVS